MPLDLLNARHAEAAPEVILRAALADARLGPLALVSSFGAESVVLLDMVARIAPDTPVIFLDTEMLFEETLAYQRALATRLQLTDIRVIRPDRAEVMAEDVDGLLHLADTEACCRLRKARPLERALDGFGGWITGRKRYQGGARTRLPVFERDGARVKINPLAGWQAADLATYIEARNLPRHPLVAQGYPSIGCRPCTSRAGHGEDPRAGRWRGQEKTECGIHFPQARAAERVERTGT